jgi:hypothetical protein
MPAAGHMAGDRDVVGLVGQDETRGRIAFRQPAQRLGFGRAAADDPVPPAFKYIANAGDGARSSGERGPFSTAPSTSPRTMWSISSSAKPEVSMGALARVSHELNN